LNLGENSLSKINQSSCVVQENISVESAIATISQASVEEISQALSIFWQLRQFFTAAFLYEASYKKRAFKNRLVYSTFHIVSL
jgi:hypothetical protein